MDGTERLRLERVLREIERNARAALTALEAGDPHGVVAPLINGIAAALAAVPSAKPA